MNTVFRIFVLRYLLLVYITSLSEGYPISRRMVRSLADWKVRGRLPNVSIICRYLLGRIEKIRESLRRYSRPGQLSYRASVEYKAEEASYLHHFSVVSELLRVMYLNICGVSTTSGTKCF